MIGPGAEQRIRSHHLVQAELSRPDYDGPVDELGLPLNFIRGTRFGQAVRNLDYPTYRSGFNGGRTALLAFGVRF